MKKKGELLPLFSQIRLILKLSVPLNLKVGKVHTGHILLFMMANCISDMEISCADII